MFPTSVFRFLPGLGLCVMLGVWTTSTFARVVITHEDAERWYDALIEQGMKARQINAAMVVVVQDGQTILAKGYGSADLQTNASMDFQRTGFRIASITKLFTATAITQLLESGAIESLDDPANKYLKRVKLPDTYGTPITIHHLLTHTAGFEDPIFGEGILADVKRPLPVGEIRRRMPTSFRPPGLYADYSNTSYAILGLIIEDVSGLEYDRYVAERIFGPLQMTRSVVTETVSPPDGLARPRTLLPDGSIAPINWLALHPFRAPTGSIVSTGADIAKFMIAVARSAADPDSPILKASYQALMFKQRFGSSSAAGPGVGYMTEVWNGERTARHGGDLPGFHSMLTLLPDSHAGFFIVVANESRVSPKRESSKADGASQAELPNFTPTSINSQFLAHLMGPRAAPANPLRMLQGDAANYTGAYVFQRRTHNTIRWIGTGVRVDAMEGGGVRVGAYGAFEPAGHGFYRGANGFDVAFKKTAAGPTLMLMGGMTAIHVSGFNDPHFLLVMSISALAIVLTGVAALRWPQAPGASPVIWVKRIPLILLATLALAAAVALIPVHGRWSWVQLYRFGHPGGAITVVVIAHVVAICAVAMVILTVLAWRNRYWGTGGRAIARRVHFSLLAAAAVALLPSLIYMRLLGWHLP